MFGAAPINQQYHERIDISSKILGMARFQKPSSCLWAFILLLPVCTGGIMIQDTPQNLILRNFEPLFREDLIIKNRTSTATGAEYYGPTASQSITPNEDLGIPSAHSSLPQPPLILFSDGAGGGGQVQTNSNNRLLLADEQTRRYTTELQRIYGTAEPNPLLQYGYPLGTVTLLQATYMLPPHSLHIR